MSQDTDRHQRRWLSFGYGGATSSIATWRYWKIADRHWKISAPHGLAEFDQQHRTVFLRGEKLFTAATQWEATWRALGYFYSEVVPALTFITQTEEVAQPTPRHLAGYEAAVRNGAIVRTRIFNSDEMLSSEKFARVAGCSRESVNKMRLGGYLLALSNDTSTLRYPVWQLEAKVHAVMPQILKILGEDPWQTFLFLTQSSPYLAGRIPLECLRSGEGSQVLAAAKAHAEELT